MHTPFLFEQLPQTFGNSNPGFSIGDDRIFARAGYNGLNALSSNIYTIYAYGYLTKESDRGRHQPFVNFLGDKEGVYIGRTRAYMGYRYIQELSEKWQISSGISFGMVNHSIKGNVAVGGASDIVLDGNLGVMLCKGNNFKVGVSMNQMLNNTLQLYTSITSLVRHYGFYVQKRYAVTPDLSMEFNGYTRFVNGLRNDYLFGATAYYKYLLGGLVYRFNYGVVTMLGINDIQWGDNSYGLAFSYRVPIRAKIPVNANLFECSVSFKFNN